MAEPFHEASQPPGNRNNHQSHYFICRSSVFLNCSHLYLAISEEAVCRTVEEREAFSSSASILTDVGNGGNFAGTENESYQSKRCCCPREPTGSACARVPSPDKVNHAGQGAQLLHKDISVYSQQEYKVVLLSQQEPGPAPHSASPRDCTWAT